METRQEPKIPRRLLADLNALAETETQTKLAERTGLSQGFISLVLAGRRSPSEELLDAAGWERIERPVVYRRKRS